MVTNLSRTHRWQREPPYVRETVFSLLDIPQRCIGRDGMIYKKITSFTHTASTKMKGAMFVHHTSLLET